MSIVEVFSCAGGMAEGLRRASLPVSMAFDWDTDACDSYASNLGHRPIQVDARELVRMLREGWRPTPAVHLLVADPPCTPWSRAGKRLGMRDDRDMLAPTIEIVRLLRPYTALIANVPGLDDAPNWSVVQQTIGSLADLGYCVDFTRLDAADYGVPQHRVRPFWFAHPFGTPCICWPERTHGDPQSLRNATIPGVQPLAPWVTCRDALSHLSLEDLGSPIRLRWRKGGSQRASVAARPARTVCTTSLGDGNALTAGPNHRPSTFDAPARTLTRNTHSDGALLVNPRHPCDGGGANGSRVMHWQWDRPSTVVTTTDRLGPPNHHGKSFLSDPNAIKLSEKAAAILQGFPEHWKFCGRAKRSRWSQIGMAMPPPLAEAVGRSIARWLGVDERTAGAT